MKTLRERFEEKYIPEPNSGCWLWIASVGNNGYGWFGIGGTQRNAHRVSYELHVGTIPEGLFVLHHCDQRSCVNPAHLFLGTQADNMADKISKRRHVYGEKVISAKLREADVRNILSSALPKRDIAEKYGVHVSTIKRIKARKRWAHVQPETCHPNHF